MDVHVNWEQTVQERTATVFVIAWKKRHDAPHNFEDLPRAQKIPFVDVVMVFNLNKTTTRGNKPPGWGLPAGGLKNGEGLFEAISREFREEVGISLPTHAFKMLMRVPSSRNGEHGQGEEHERVIFQCSLDDYCVDPPVLRPSDPYVRESQFVPVEMLSMHNRELYYEPLYFSHMKLLFDAGIFQKHKCQK